MHFSRWVKWHFAVIRCATASAAEVVRYIYLLFAQLNLWLYAIHSAQFIARVHRYGIQLGLRQRADKSDWIKWCGLDMSSNKTSLKQSQFMTIDISRIVRKCAGYARLFSFLIIFSILFPLPQRIYIRIHIIQIHISCFDINQLLVLNAISVRVQFVQFRMKSRTMTNDDGNDDDHHHDDDECALHIMH